MKIKLPELVKLGIDEKVDTLISDAFTATSEDDVYERMNNIVEFLRGALKSELSDSWFKVDTLKSELKEQKKDFLKMLHKAEKERDLYKERLINKQ